MAILVIQLARFGDIFQTWPALKALRRANPGAELHLLVRERFVAATEGLQSLGIRVHTLPTAEILRPLVQSCGDVLHDEAAAINQIENFLAPLRSVHFTKIVNLSFSPFSSYLTDELATKDTEVHGYTRHADGFLSIPDDSSAYFYAQVGVGKSNRYHLCDVFAAASGVDLDASDYSHPSRVAVKGNSVIVHMGASQANKVYPAEMWSEVIAQLVGGVEGSVILVGSSTERKLADAVTARVKSGRLLNRVGQSSLSDLCHWIAEAALLIGADSAPVQIATLTGTKVLNLSCATVNFWETGPLTDGSRVLYAHEMHQISPATVVAEALAILHGTNESIQAIVRANGAFEVGSIELWSNDFKWKLIQALYTAADFPELPEESSALAFHRIFDAAELALSQIDQWRQSGPSSTINAILESVDQMLQQLPAMDGNVQPVIDWFQTQRLRLPPADELSTLKSMRALFEQLLWIAAVYHRRSEGHRMLERAAELAKVCAPKLREYEFNTVQDSFQELISIAQVAASSPTKVGDNPWPEVLTRLQMALERRDFIEAADILESDWTEVLQSARGQISWESGNSSSETNSPTPHPA